MLADALVALAGLAGNAVVTAAATDTWETVRHKFARLLGRGDQSKEQLAADRLEETRKLLSEAAAAELEQARAAQAERWAGRLADFLEENPDAQDELQALVAEVEAAHPAATVSAVNHSVAAGRDVNIQAKHGAVAAGVIHGNVTPGPTTSGPAED